MPIKINFQLDLTQFQEAVRYVYANSRRTMPEIVNRGALVSIIGGSGVQGAMQRTLKANREAILSVPIKKVAGYVLARHKGQKLTRKRMYSLIRKEYRRRIKAIGYTAYVGWDKAARDFGGRGIGGRRASGAGYASMGSGSPSNEGQWPFLVAEMVNAAPAAAFIGELPLQQAINDAARDMMDYCDQRMQQIVNSA